MVLAGGRLSPKEDVTGGGGWCKQGAAGLWCWRGVQAVQAAPRPSYVSQPRLDQLLLGSGRATLLPYKYKYKYKYKYEYKYNQLLLGSGRATLLLYKYKYKNKYKYKYREAISPFHLPFW